MLALEPQQNTDTKHDAASIAEAQVAETAETK